MNKREVGTQYETEACRYLESRGFRLIEKNFRCRTGEIDLIMADGRYIVFLEVKYRKTGRFGQGENAVTAAKQKTICRTAAFYLMSHGKSDCDCRFDVVAINGEGEISHYPNAFEYR